MSDVRVRAAVLAGPRVGVVAAAAPASSPRLGFLGGGWIGRHRMRALLALVEVQATLDRIRER